MFLTRKEVDGDTVATYLAPDMFAAKGKVREWAGHPIDMNGGTLYIYGKSNNVLYTIMNVENSVLINILTRGVNV